LFSVIRKRGGCGVPEVGGPAFAEATARQAEVSGRDVATVTGPVPRLAAE